ncbi:SMI1/KNR4 family protein [Actinomycetospora atypica]|uniref:SMI1/KNR4 family protein n=1 Tax=Actinomycetospora atypica TaxID=1290095 RepID=A0ABV9YTT6_9PSEU
MTDGRQPLFSTPRGSARGGVPDDELRTAWSGWLGSLRAHGLDPSPVLRPGAAPTMLAAAEQEIGTALPEDVRALYALCDGQEDPDEVGGPVLFPAHAFCSLARGLDAWRAGAPGAGWPLAGDDRGHLLRIELGSPGGRVLADGDERPRELAPDLVTYLGLLAHARLELPDARASGDAAWDAPTLR